METEKPSEGRLQVTPSQSISRTSSVSSLDPKTDRAISKELSRVYLDPTVKARIRSYIYQELKKNGQTNGGGAALAVGSREQSVLSRVTFLFHFII